MRRSILSLSLLLLVVSCSSGVSQNTTSLPQETTITSTVATSPATVPEPTTTIPASTSTTTAEAGFDVILEGGTPEIPEVIVQGPDQFSFTQGEEVAISILSSVDDEIHVHGYDILYEATAGEVTLIQFQADVPGIFEVELEGRSLRLFEIKVSP